TGEFSADDFEEFQTVVDIRHYRAEEFNNGLYVVPTRYGETRDKNIRGLYMSNHKRRKNFCTVSVLD
ncbi:hypothetical protein, partial [Alicyclobacillus fastidiosus]